MLNDVRHILDLKRNLISTSTLDIEGYITTFGDYSWKTTKGSMVIAKGKMHGKLYLLLNASHVFTLDLVTIGVDAKR